MGLCPKCKSALAGELIVCPKCGAQLATGEEVGGSDTLNVFEHGDLESAQPTAEPSIPAPVSANSDNEGTRVEPADAEAIDLDATIDSVLEAVPAKASGSDTLDVDLGLTPDPNQIEATRREIAEEAEGFGTAQTSHLSAEDLPDSTPEVDVTMDSDSVPAEGDDVGTVVNAQDRSGSSKATAVYSETELREALDGVTSGTGGKLKRLWEAAAGSSDNPSHTLRGEEALASDSVFNRVAVRKLAPANAPSETEADADYILVDKVGQGGMGIVYSARQTNVNRLVALKQIKAQYQSVDDSRRKFFYEAQITADLDHPNIVPIYELGATESGSLFYSMKLITGAEWKDAIKTNSREENLEILAKVNDAMAFAHSKGIVHRDLKPANTMIGTYGEVYVTDWGMAIDTRTKLRFGPGGSPAYMAPEMALHQIEKIGPASDIYILGAILFQIVTGLPPHPGKSVQDTLRSAARNIISDHKSEDALLPIALKAMATNVEDRYKSVEEFQAALRENRQHSDSIALAKRSEELLNRAVLAKDYDLFSRAVFGYRDAVELWPANEGALAGQRCAQLEYGRCAVGKGDFDLAMQVLDRSQPDQALVYQQAVKGKQAIADREKRVKNLRRIVAAVVLIGSSIISVAALRLWQQSSVIKAKNDQLTIETNKALDAKLVAETKTVEANNAAAAALAAKELETTARMNEQVQREKAEKSEAKATEKQMLAEAKTIEAESATAAANAAKIVADMQRMNAEAAKMAEESARKLAEAAAAQIKLEEFKAALPLAKSQVESFDVRAARKSLKESSDLKADAFKSRKPKSDTWPWQRVNLLSNLDLPQAELESGATAADYVTGINLGVVGTKKGKVQVLRFVNGKLEKLFAYEGDGGEIEGVAISPKGDEIVFNVRKGNENAFCVWPISATGPLADPKPVAEAAKQSLQGFAYSQDGAYLVAGINQGVWLWKRNDKWFNRKADNHYQSIRGRLNSIHLIDESHAIIAAQFRGLTDESLMLYAVDLKNQNSSKKVTLPNEIETLVTAVSYDSVNKQVILGTTFGKLLTASLQPRKVDTSASTSTGAQSPDKKVPGLEVIKTKEILPTDKHRTAIKHIVTTTQGQMITTGAEPVMHVWQRDPEMGWTYDTYLTGTQANLAAAVFVGKGAVLGIDEGGSAMVWDIQRQKQRRQLKRVEANGIEPAEYADPIVGLFTTNDGQAIAVNAKGMIDRWDINTGATLPFDGERWLFAGHTPGAEFIDVAVDAEAGIVATAARLNNVKPLYLKPGDGMWEFCIWDQAKGTMLRRWRAEAEKPEPGESAEMAKQKGVIEQRLSLVDSGRALILASDKVTRLFSLDGKELFLAKDFGTYFAVPNPQTPNQLMLVKRSGAVVVLDLKKLGSWSSAPREYALTTVSDTPQQGTWSPDGKNFYLTFTSGAVAAFAWNGSKIQLEWSSHKLDGEKETLELQKALSSDATRVKSHADIDMAVRVNGDKRTLYVVRRARGATGETVMTAVQFTANGSVRLAEQAARVGVCWLDNSGEEPSLNPRLHNKLRVDTKQVLASSRIKNQIYITTSNANVFRLSADSDAFASLGNERLKSVTGSRNAALLVALYEDGSLKRFELTDSKNPWKPCGYAAIGCNRAALSPDGTQLALIGKEQGRPYIRVVQTGSGEEVMRIEDAVEVAWDPSSNADGVIAYANGKLETFVGHNRTAIATEALVTDARIVSIHYLTETWSDPTEKPIRHLVLHTETKEKGQIQFVPLVVDPSAANTERNFDSLETLPLNARLSVSPTEAVLVSGDDAGTVKLWFASPTWDGKAKELYELEGHRGAKIELATFNQDGTTLISADSKNRVYGWLSHDKTQQTAP